MKLIRLTAALAFVLGSYSAFGKVKKAETRSNPGSMHGVSAANCNGSYTNKNFQKDKYNINDLLPFHAHSPQPVNPESSTQ